MKNIAPPGPLKTLFTKDLDFITKALSEYYPGFSLRQQKKIENAFWFAAIAHDGQTRFSGEPYFTHPIAATKILLQIKPDIDTACTCLMHDVIEDTDVTAQEVQNLFGEHVRFLCEGVEKVTKIRLQGQEREHESLRKLFVAMAQDIRVIFIKLADRIHNLQTLEHIPPEKKKRIANESMAIYAAVAEKLGLYEFKHQIEDLCFKNLQPDIYEDISKQTEQSLAAQKKFINKAKKEISKAMKEEKISYVQISGRYKNLYSIYSKLKRKNFSHVSEIFDLVGIRIILNETSDCYRCLGAIHGRWKPIATRFKDYVAVPKPNGYQSLHTTLLGISDSTTPTEIQIRTEEMHLDAELGPAAHWAYKETRSSNFDAKYLEKMNWLPATIEEQNENKQTNQFFNKISESLSQDRIHVFTPRGDIKNLIKGASIIDFAYNIHSDIGHTCIAGKINGSIKPLSHQLKNGDVVEIVTRNGRGPNPLWLNFAKSPSARSHIRNYLNKHQIKTLAKEANASDEKVLERKLKTHKAPASAKTSKKVELFIGGEKTTNFHLASCCKPKATDVIVAYVPRGNSFSVHKQECKTLNRLENERILDANFIHIKKITIEGTDRTGMMRQIFDILEQHQQNIISSKLKTNGPVGNEIQWKITVESPSLEDFADTVEDLKAIPNVNTVK